MEEADVLGDRVAIMAFGRLCCLGNVKLSTHFIGRRQWKDESGVHGLLVCVCVCVSARLGVAIYSCWLNYVVFQILTNDDRAFT